MTAVRDATVLITGRINITEGADTLKSQYPKARQ
jgi:hypothetical protein